MAYGNNLRLHSKSPEGRRARLDPVEIQKKICDLLDQQGDETTHQNKTNDNG